MMEHSQAIPEAEELLEQSLMMSAALRPEKQFPPQIKELQRDVDKLISRFPSHFSQLHSSVIQSPDNNAISKQVLAGSQSKCNRPYISRYNYTGRMYRFEEAEKHLNIEKPTIEQTKTQKYKESLPSEMASAYNSRASVLAEDSFDRSEVKFPSYNYHIVFDQKNKKQKKEKQKEHDKMAKTIYLQKKVRKLQEEMKEMRLNAARTTGSFRKDGRIKLEKFLESMIG